MTGKTVPVDERSTSTASVALFTTSVSSGDTEPASSSAIVRMKGSAIEAEMKGVEAAVLAHIQALRAIGKQTANTASISDALGIPLYLVDLAVEGLREKGVTQL